MSSLRTTIGANVLPANPNARTGGAVTVTDKGLDTLLALLAAAIQSELGALYNSILSGPAVRSVIPFDVRPWLKTMRPDYPAISGSSANAGKKSLSLDSSLSLSNVLIHYVMPPVSAEQWVSANGLLKGAENACLAAIDAGYHPDYNGGFLALFGPNSPAGYHSVEVLGTSHGRLVPSSEIQLPTLEFRLKTAEPFGLSQAGLDERAPLEGVGLQVDQGELVEFALGDSDV